MTVSVLPHDTANLLTLAAVVRGEPCLEHPPLRHRQPSVALTLRAATTDDTTAVARVLIDSRRELMPFAPSTHSDGSVHQWVRDTLIPSGGVTVAAVGGAADGAADGAVAAVLALSAHAGVAWIDHLYVHPTQVARGIGRRLLMHALATLPRPVQLHTFQANHHARAFYERHGFSAVAFSDGSGNEERCPDVLYRLA